MASKKGRSAARRVPGAPRTIHKGAGYQEPWFRRRGFQIGVAAGLIVMLVMAIVLVARSRGEDAELERRQQAVEDFTGETLTLLQKLSPSASEMLTTTVTSKTLKADARRWDKTLTQVQQEAATAFADAPFELDATNRLVFQSVLEYIAAAKTYQLVTEAKGDLKAKILERAAAQVAAADGTWTAGIVVLDQERQEVDLDPSGLRAPSEVAAAPTPAPTGG